MLRWKLTLGLLATLLILLLVGAYGVWLSNDLGRAVDNVLRDNYGSIKVCHYMRTATARVNTFYSRGDRAYPPFDQPSVLNDTAKEFDLQLPVLVKNAKTDEERQWVADLRSACKEYADAYRNAFELFQRQPLGNNGSFTNLRGQVPSLTLKIADLSEKILERNESLMFRANEKAEKQAKTSIRILFIAMISAVVVFVFSFVRLGNSVIVPVRNLTRSIRELRARQFDRSLPVAADDEIGALTREFNAMAEELRVFYRETDLKIIELNQVIRAMMNTLPYPLFILRDRDEIARMNPAAERLVDALNWRGQMPPSIRRHFTEVPASGADYRLDELKQALMVRIADQEVYFLPRLFPIVLDDGKAFGTAVMLVDVTRFRWLDEMRSDMLATLSHEIKTPLTGIRLVLHILLEKSAGALTEMQEELVGSARNDCEKLLKTLNSILDLARMESGKAQLNLQSLPGCQLAEDLFQSFLKLAKDSSRPLRKDVPDHLPMVQVDSERLSLVFSNFLSNAIKYGYPRSEICLRVSKQHQDFVRFSVINSGPGLSEEDIPRVFDKFYRSPRQKGEGVGLGLSIARLIVQAHEGRIGVISEEGKLTEFYCDIPISSSRPDSKSEEYRDSSTIDLQVESLISSRS
ncbi:MAG: HAMP domain-containing protein [Verrucomicrobia bacterium]|nr:HAMP domain-containing protein [Verrucomicrobiota bacterium]